ncbi:unnamed protein product [Aphanomyces euteiches]|uniref:ENTH domain-containing protein n=1 Tax=Aphanomyces euteiches TaxID=100861 RepID=A0A6G0WPT9_9STRA|nr:hypothetical protein Ae201684_012937 [Aphanomyces euteiches]KAH9097562.1 hypothetical protein Ae201684P_001040 [Aphanomyces euteiches]KAH9099020.1 hypothetical protein LEN26_016424 [Aphanomyces euteiches]KAH9154015.1 hypothetical protein AeRB84_003814 [Aphanomyces euteiches]
MDKTVLARATEDSDSPTPGYLYGEIARMTQHSYDTCLKVQEYLIGRLKKSKPNIKYKALQVIKHSCREGRQDFRREMQKHVPVIKEALQFRGPPDPLKGDEYYRRVRDAAKECLDAIFDTNVSGVAGISNRIKGVGNPEAAPQPTGWFNRGSKDANQPPQQQFQGPGVYGGPGGYDPSGFPGGFNGPPYPGNEGPGGYGGPPGAYGGSQYPGGAPPPFGNQPNPNQMQGMGNPLFEEKKGGESKGFFGGLKEKVSFKSEPKVTFAGGPPGSQNPPEGWSFATNRGPTAGAFNPNANATYNPSEPYRPNPPSYGGPTGYAAPSGLYNTTETNSDHRQHQSQELREKAYEGERKKGRVGGVWDGVSTAAVAPSLAAPARNQPSYDPQQPTNRAERIQNEWAQEQYNQSYVRRNSSGQPPLPQQTAGASSDGSYERGIIESLCAPGGMRAVPPKDKLDAFLKSALTLDAEVVGPILDDLLTNDAWQVVSKALTVIDGLLATSGCETFHDYFSDNYDMILQVSTASDKAAVRDRAVKILHVLGKASSAPSTSSSSSNRRATATSTNSGTDLLGGFDDAPQQPPSSSTSSSSALFASQPPSSSGGGGGLFAGLQTSGEDQSAPPPHQSHQQQQSVNSAADMFGGLTLGGGSTDSSSQKPPATSSTSSFDPLLQPTPAPQAMPMNMYSHAQPMAMMGHAPMAPMPYMQPGYMQPMMPMVAVMPPMQPMQPMQPMLAKPMMPTSQVIGAAMIPTGYIAKTIHEPTDDKANVNYMGRDDSFNFVKDHMKGS